MSDPINNPTTRPFSSRDTLYERLQGISESQSKQDSFGYEMTPEKRELTLRLMLKLIGNELESLKFEALNNNDQFALECLHNIAYESTRQLLLLCQQNSDMAAQIARHEQVWPIPYGRDNATRKAVELLAEVLHLGEDRASIFDTGNMLSETSDARQWLAMLTSLMNRVREEASSVSKIHKILKKSDGQTAAIISGLESIPLPNATQDQIFDHLKSFVIDPDVIARLAQLFEVENPFSKNETVQKFVRNCAKLPTLRGDKYVVKEWVRVIRELMMDVYDGHPEKSSLRWIGEYLAKGKEDSSPKGTASYESNLRAGIFQRLERTLLNVAKE